MKPFEIFRSGTHTDSRGRPFAFSDDDLAAIASSYDPALSHAPIVVGHPKQDDPAYGWVKSVAFRDGRLVVEPEDLESQFADLVRTGRFRQRSAAFFAPDHPNNPTPGRYYLRHVGFLGAAAPAVKGLKAVEFGDDEALLEFQDMAIGRAAWGFELLSKVIRGFRDFVVAEKGIDVADGILPAWQIDQIAETAQQLRDEIDASDPTTSYSDEDNNMSQEMLADIKRREAELAAREATFADQQRTEQESRKRIRASEDATFVASMVEAGRLPAGLKDLATALFADLGADDTMSFSDGGEERSLTPRDGLRQLIERLPLPVVQGELATGDGPDFSDPAHVATAITTEIETARARGEHLSAAEAGMRLTRRR
ncbi:hypothetical protein SAMN05880590_1315 [Rhizobium sp. RU35A]|uniref:peptidase n=1 Tax=Rhizobium sp. RU35A TaxID=1907414 RepID=UPI000954FB85|nr:peptidase [Rhizobium sp. RU35A]SIR42762.1 hypothetical protein SAMN05880590_1315 [Rhizobium sp. RU35A]